MSSPLSLSAFGMPTPRAADASSLGSAGRGAGSGESGGGLFVVDDRSSDAVGIRVLQIDPEDGGYCGGRIGKSGIKMCIRPVAECSTQSHRRFKAEVKVLGDNRAVSQEGVFTDTKTPMTVYTTEVLPIEMLPKPFQLYADDLRPPSQWGAYFRSLAKRPHEIDPRDLEAMSQAHEEMLDSPYKKRRVIDLEEGSANADPKMEAVELKLAHLANLNAATNSLWFKRFMIGCHRRMGDVWLPDRPLTAPIFRQCMNILDAKWLEYTQDTVGLWKTSLIACMLLAGYYGALRGEEIARVDVGLMNKHWTEAISHEAPHVPLMLSGRFKHVDGERIFCQPLAVKTQAGMDVRVWFQRALKIYKDKGIHTGPLFRDVKGKRIGVAELDVWFRALLKSVQDNHPNLISDDSDLERFSIRRSARRGATAEAQNSGIPEEVIEANNRWRKQFRSKGLNPRMSMLERYTDAKANVPHLVQFSWLLRH